MKGISTSKTLMCKYEIENVGDSIYTHDFHQKLSI